MKEKRYIAVRSFDLEIISRTLVSGAAFKELFIREGISKQKNGDCLCVSEGALFTDSNNISLETLAEMEKHSFIEEGYENPNVRLGFSFIKKDGVVYTATWCYNNQMTFTVSHITTPVDYTQIGATCKSFTAADFHCKLSDIVGEDNLSEFTRVNLKTNPVNEWG